MRAHIYIGFCRTINANSPVWLEGSTNPVDPLISSYNSYFLFLSLLPTTLFNNGNTKQFQVFIIILAGSWILPQCGALRPLGVMIPSNLLWSIIKLFITLPDCWLLDKTSFLTLYAHPVQLTDHTVIGLGTTAHKTMHWLCEHLWLIRLLFTPWLLWEC